jgi:hypothetical protein
VPEENGEALVRRLQQAIQKIEGVTSAGVILDEKGGIAEIHLVALPFRRPKQIVRDTESLLYAQFGIRVDYRRISLARVDAEEASTSRTRLRFISAAPQPGTEGVVQVVLRCEDDCYEGVSAVEPWGLAGQEAHAAADATLGAVQKAIGRAVQLTAHEAQTVSADGNQVCLVIVHAATPRGEEHLTGSCIVVQSVLEAAAKATLDAINRRLPVWVTLPEPRPAKGKTDPARA